MTIKELHKKLEELIKIGDGDIKIVVCENLNDDLCENHKIEGVTGQWKSELDIKNGVDGYYRIDF